MCLFSHMFVYMCRFMWRPKVDTVCPQLFSTWLFETGSHWLELTGSIRLAGQQGCFCLLSGRIATGVCHLHWLWDSNSGSSVWAASTFINWAISPGPCIPFYILLSWATCITIHRCKLIGKVINFQGLKQICPVICYSNQMHRAGSL